MSLGASGNRARYAAFPSCCTDYESMTRHRRLLITVIAFMLGIWLCGETANALGVHDHSGIVWDEIVGYLVTMIAVPLDWKWIVLGFLLFRLFDIAKPWPIGWIDSKLSGGLGIMLDDILAGFFALIALHLVITLVKVS